MQNAKDTFYDWMRTRLNAVNPARTVSVRGVLRPSLLVAENEAANTQLWNDCFVLRWRAPRVVGDAAALPLCAMDAEFSYSTCGTAAASGLDRGRLLSAMDEELLQMLSVPQRGTAKQSWAGSPAVAAALSTRIWWSSPEFATAEEKDGSLSRNASVTVWSYEEAGGA